MASLRFGATMICACATSSSSTSAAVASCQMPLQAALEARRQDELIAGHDRTAKARLVDADEVHAGIGVGDHVGADVGQQPRHLRERFDDEHARHHRPAGKVTGEVRLVEADVLQRADALAAHALEHPIHQQERIAVRQPLHDAADIELDRL